MGEYEAKEPPVTEHVCPLKSICGSPHPPRGGLELGPLGGTSVEMRSRGWGSHGGICGPKGRGMRSSSFCEGTHQGKSM